MLKSDQMVIYIESFEESSSRGYAKGYLEFPKDTYWEWPSCFIAGEKYIYPGDEEYLEYCTPFYIKAVKIDFEFEYIWN